MKVSLIVPVYNEAHHLSEFLAKVDNLDLPATKELVFVNDCSTDGTRRILDEFSFKSEVQVVHQPSNRGKGAAIQAGIAQATGDLIGVQDADFEYDMDEIPPLLLPLIDGRADIVYGSRFKKSGEQVHRTFHYLVNRFLTILSTLCTGLYLTDMETCYKFFKREIITNIQLDSQRFGFEPEVTAKIARLKLRVFELPISYYPRNYGEGKKISWKDGVAAVRHILYYNFGVKPSVYLKPGLPETYRPPKEGRWL